MDDVVNSPWEHSKYNRSTTWNSPTVSLVEIFGPDTNSDIDAPQNEDDSPLAPDLQLDWFSSTEEGPNFEDVWNRLFDHRPFLSGEIKYFIKEFEETRGGSELARLEEIGEYLKDIEFNLLPKVTNSTFDFNKVNTLIDIAVQTTETILEEENNFDLDKLLATKRANRQVAWEEFKAKTAEKHIKIDQTFAENEKKVIQFYEELEKKLLDS